MSVMHCSFSRLGLFGCCLLPFLSAVPLCQPINEGLTDNVENKCQTCVGLPGIPLLANDPGNERYATFVREFDSGPCQASEQPNRKIPTIDYDGNCQASTSRNESYTRVRDSALHIHSKNIYNREFLDAAIKCYRDKWGTTNEWNHNGVVCENIEIVRTDVKFGRRRRRRQNVIRLNFRGDLYSGSVKGVNKVRGQNLPADPMFCTSGVCPELTEALGQRTGAALITNDFYGPGFYRVRARVPPTPDEANGGKGYIFSFWTYYYAEVGAGPSSQYIGGQYEESFNPSSDIGATIWNQEIDFEIPANAPQLRRDNDLSAMDWGTANVNTFLTETFRTGGDDNVFQNTVLRSKTDRQAFISKSGEFHDYAFKWYVDVEDPRNNFVEYYFDGCRIARVDKFVPTRGAPFYVGALPLWWSSSKFADGALNFDSVQVDIAEIQIEPQKGLDTAKVAFPQTYDQDFSGSCQRSCFKRSIFD